MRLRTRVCAASAALALTALPFATTSALADGTGDAAESTDVAPADDDPATATVDGTIAPEATTTLTTPSETPEDVASPEGDEPSEQDEDSKSPAEDAPDDVPNDPEAPEEPEQPPEEPGVEEPEASEDTTVGGPTISTPPASATESGTPTNTGGTDDPTVTPTDDPDGNGSTETETDPEDSATCDGGAGDNTEGGASTEEPARTVKGALVPRLIAQQSATTTTQKSQSPTASTDTDGDATDCPCNCPTTPGDDSSDDSTDDGSDGSTGEETDGSTGEETTDEGDDTSTGGGSGEKTEDESTPDDGATPPASPSVTPEMSEPSTPAQPAPEPERRAQPLPAPPPSEDPEPTADPAPEPAPETPSETPVEEPETTAESSTTEETEVAGVGTEEPSTPAPQAAQPTSSGDGGPVVRLFNAISDDSNTAFGQMRQVLIAALAIGFLTTAGFVGATWHSRRSNHRR